MFPDIGGTELIIVAIVALLVVKPKDLPVMMRKFGEFTNKARRMAADFRASFDDMARQSELDDLRKEVEAMRAKTVDPLGMNSALNQVDAEINQGLSDPNFDYGYSHTDDNSIPWDPSSMPSEAETMTPPTPPKKKAAPRKKAATAIAEGALPVTSDVVSPPKRKRSPAKKAV